MNNLIKDNVSWDKIIKIEGKEFSFNLGKGKLDREKAMLTLPISANFVMPFSDAQKIIEKVKSKITDLKNIELEFTYYDIIQEETEIIKAYIPYIIAEINGDYATYTKTIFLDKLNEENGKVTLYVVGDRVSKILNDKVAVLFQRILNDKFGIQRIFEFENNKEHCSKVKLEAEKQEKEYKLEESKPKSENKEASIKNNGSTYQKKENRWSRNQKKMTERPVSGTVTPLKEITQNSGVVVVKGILFKKDVRSIKNDKVLMSLFITDKKTSMCVKGFAPTKHWEEMDKELKLNKMLTIKGEAQEDMYDHITTIMAQAIKVEEVEKKQDNAPVKRVELHVHTKMSAMDGLNEVADLVKTHEAWGHKAMAITDHGVVQAFPEASHALSKDSEMKLIYGMEGYVFDDSDCKDEDGNIDYKKKKTNHIILLAKNKQGLKNLYKLVSVSHLDYFYKKPRLPKSIIEKHREGIIIGSACEAGEVFRGLVNKVDENKMAELVNFYDYLEIQPLVNNQFLIKRQDIDVWTQDQLKELNKKVVALGEKYGKPVVATTDAHYKEPEDAIYRNILMASLGFKDYEVSGLYLRTTEEMLEEFQYLGEEKAQEVVVTNTNKIADMIEKMEPVPKGKFPPKIDNAEEILREKCYNRAWEMYGKPLPAPIKERLETEIEPIIREGYAVMYIAAEMLVQKSMEDGYLVGSRGSVGSSFVATMAGITEVNPLPPHYLCPKCKNLEWGDETKYDCGVDMEAKNCPKCDTPYKREGFSIPFQTFLGFEADKEPDIDLNFAGEYQGTAHKFVDEIFGKNNVYKAGTIGTIADKTAYGFVMNYIDETKIPVVKPEIDRLTKSCTGVKRTTGQHPGGIIIVPDDHDIHEFCPIQYPANDSKSGIITTHFDYHSIDQNLLKLDILGHDVPSMIRHLQDMTGIDNIDDIPLSDEKVNALFVGIDSLDIKSENYSQKHGTFGIPEFGTEFTRGMLDDTQPTRFADFVRISGFSHGTDVWLNNAKDWITSGVATIKDAISTRDDIMNYLIQKGLPKKSAFTIMEKVRKGKGVTPEEVELMEQNDVPEWYIESCRRIKYMFPKAHAVAYVMMAYRIAYFKVYYPAQFYSAYFTTKTGDFDANTILKGEQAVFDKIQSIRKKDKNATKKEKDEMTVLEVAYEMYARGYEFKMAELGLSHYKKFNVSEGKVLLPFVVLEGVGENTAKALAEEYENKVFESIEDLRERAKINKTALEGLRETGLLDGLPESNQMSFLNGFM